MLFRKRVTIAELESIGIGRGYSPGIDGYYAVITSGFMGHIKAYGKSQAQADHNLLYTVNDLLDKLKR